MIVDIVSYMREILKHFTPHFLYIPHLHTPFFYLTHYDIVDTGNEQHS